MPDVAPPPLYCVDTNTFMDWQQRYTRLMFLSLLVRRLTT